MIHLHMHDNKKIMVGVQGCTLSYFSNNLSYFSPGIHLVCFMLEMETKQP
jgi:hypothetical protein